MDEIESLRKTEVQKNGGEKYESDPEIKNPQERWTLKRVLIGVLIIIGVVVTWVGATQLTKSTLVDPNKYYAPYFNVYFSTTWMCICYPVFLIGFLLLRKPLKDDRSLGEAFNDNQRVFGSNGATPLSVAIRTLPFTFFWIAANYSYAQALGHVSAAETTGN